MKPQKTEAIKVRVPSVLKQAINRIADRRLTTESEIVREAIIAYLDIKAPGATAEPSSLPAEKGVEASIQNAGENAKKQVAVPAQPPGSTPPQKKRPVRRSKKK